MRTRRTVLASLVVLALLAAGCGGDDEGDGSELMVATTVSPLTNIVANVAGTLAAVRGIVPEGANSHTFEPAPSVAEILAEADLIFVNGLHLEEPVVRLAERNKRSGVEIVELGDEALPPDDFIYDFSFPRSEGNPNPHLWTDPTYVRRYASIVADALARLDPAHAAEYRANEARYGAKVDALDSALRAASATLAPEARKLLTYHDAYAYFARTYGWKVVGAIQVSNFEDPTPKELAALIDQVKSEGVKAVFGSEVFPSPVLAQIGRETGVRYVDELRDDDLPGGPGDASHTLIALLRSDYMTMISALGGDPAALESLDVADVTTSKARYPQ